MASKFHSKLREQDTDDVKQKTSLFSVHGKSAWNYFKAFVLSSFRSSVSGTQNMPELPSQPSSPPIYYMNLS